MKSLITTMRLTAILFLIFLFPLSAISAVPTTMTYQGKLSDGGGSPLNATVDITFNIYDVSTGGATLWSETQSVTVTNGIFTVSLGSSSAIDSAIFTGNVNTWIGITIGVDSEMTPRQKLESTPYSMSAGYADMAMSASSATTASSTPWSGLTGVPADIADGDGDTLAGLGCTINQVAKHNGTNWVCSNEMAALIADVAALKTLLTHFSRSGSEVTIAGANLNIVNGTGMTDGAVNGLGNLTVGYNELRGGGNDNRGGSHNIVGGVNNNYTSYGGFVVGHLNTISGSYSSVNGGNGNIASGAGSSVSGGRSNKASNLDSSVNGGSTNTASGNASAVSGGYGNTASGNQSSVSGGSGNTAFAAQSSVSGGYTNTASGNWSSVSGGRGNTAPSRWSSVTGGNGNNTTSEYQNLP